MSILNIKDLIIVYTQVYPLQLSRGVAMSDSYILVLDAPEVHKHVPILIGESEAQAIILAIEQKEVARPLTHTLICNLMEEYMLTLKQVTIDRFEEGIFYSSLCMNDGFSDKNIDCRASDAVVLALLNQCAIMMDINVLNDTCMDPGAIEGNLPRNKTVVDESLEELEARLRKCEENEDYEQAAEIMKLIERLKG